MSWTQGAIDRDNILFTVSVVKDFGKTQCSITSLIGTWSVSLLKLSLKTSNVKENL